MEFNINNADAERQKTLKFAEDNDISTEEVEQIYEKIYDELPDDLSESAKELRALRKTRGSLRRIANSSANYIDGFIFMRFRDNDFNVNAWNKVDKYVKENGIDKAKEQGLVNDEGEYVFTSYTTNFSDQMGKVIDKKDARGNAIGIFKGEDGIDTRFISIGKFSVWDEIPLCREIAINVKEATTPGRLFPKKHQYFLNGVRFTTMSHYYSAEDFQAYANMIEDECGDIFFSMESDIADFAHNNSDDKFNFVAAFGTVNRIGMPLDNGSVPIELELDDGLITVWADKNIFKDLIVEEGILGLAFLNTYIKNDDTVGYRIGGFLPLADD